MRTDSILARSLVMMLLFLTFFLASCAKEQLVDGNGTTVAPPDGGGSVRPEIPRAEAPADGMPTTRPSDDPVLRSFLDTTLFVRHAPEGIVAGDAAHPFLFGKKLGEVLPLLTRNELSLLAAPMPTLQGQPLRAEDYVRFDFDENGSGELRFTEDPDTRRPGSELFFAEGAPLFEYAYLLRDGAFPTMVGEQLAFFGHTYLIAEATNSSIQLNGLDVEQYLSLENGSFLGISGKGYPDTRVRVDPWSVVITYYAPAPDDGGIRLKPGERLRGKLKNPAILLNGGFDIAYDGMEQDLNATVTFHGRQEEATADLHNLNGERLTLTLATEVRGAMEWGDGRGRLHVKECRSRDDFCIAKEEKLILTTRSSISGAMDFYGIDANGDYLSLRDLASGERHEVELAYTKRNVSDLKVMEGQLRAEDSVFLVRVLLNESVRGGSRISVDMDGDGAISGKEVPFVLYGGMELRFPEKLQTETARRLEFVMPKLGTVLKEERTAVTLTRSGDRILVGTNATLAKEKDEDVWRGMTGRGATATLADSADGKLGWTLTLAYPPDYRAGIVRILG